MIRQLKILALAAALLSAPPATSFVMADPGLVGWDLVVKPGKKYDSLVMRDAQHEYVYTPVE